MKTDGSLYEFVIERRDWCTGAGQPASILWFEGRTWYAGVGTRAEHWLLDNGAIPVALLRFDADPVETVHRQGVVDPLTPRAALQHLSAV